MQLGGRAQADPDMVVAARGDPGQDLLDNLTWLRPAGIPGG
jgi:hypothetical protein